MGKKVEVVGKGARRIDITGTPMRRIEPEEFAAALGAEPIGEKIAGNPDPITLAALGSELIKRLRSTGGRPALADADERCKVPLSADDVAALDEIGDVIAKSTGTKPSVGQIASVILRMHLESLKGESHLDATPEKLESPINLIRDLIDERLKPIRDEVARLKKELSKA